MSNTHAISLKRSTALLTALSLLAMLFVVNFSAFFGRANAEQLLNRSLSLSSSLSGSVTEGDPGSATNGSAAEHTFNFTAVEEGTTSTTFTYCTTAIGDNGSPTGTSGCQMPTGLAIPAIPTASLGTAAVGTNANQIVWTHSYDDDTIGVTFEGITNPTSVGTFFVRIETNGGDEGTVASAITEGITITTRVVETLGFSTTAASLNTIDAGSASSCDPLTGSGAINLGLAPDYTLDINNTYDAFSAFRIYTNAANGAAVQYVGDTLRKDASNDIDPIGGTAATPTIGDEEFGLAIDLVADAGFPNKNTTDGGLGQLLIGDEYDGGNSTSVSSGAFAFVADTPTTIASSSTTGGYINCDTYAVQYMANVSPVTPSGTYTTTLSFVAVPEY